LNAAPGVRSVRADKEESEMANRQSESASNVPDIVFSLSPRGLRPPAAALYIGGTAGLIEQLWRDGLLPYRLVGGVRVALIEDLDQYLDSLPRQTGKLREPVAATQARREGA
jgi:hypothetical protein